MDLGGYVSKVVQSHQPGELEDGALSVGSARDDEDIGGVLDGGDGPGSEQHLLPGHLEVDDVDAVDALLEDVLLHGRLGVLRADVGRGSQHLGHVSLLEHRNGKRGGVNNIVGS